MSLHGRDWSFKRQVEKWTTDLHGGWRFILRSALGSRTVKARQVKVSKNYAFAYGSVDASLYRTWITPTRTASSEACSLPRSLSSITVSSWTSWFSASSEPVRWPDRHRCRTISCHSRTWRPKWHILFVSTPDTSTASTCSSGTAVFTTHLPHLTFTAYELYAWQF